MCELEPNPWGQTEGAIRDQWMALQAMLTALTLMRQLGNTVDDARQAGTRHLYSPLACVWFNAESLTINVSFNDPLSAGAQREFAGLAANGFHGFMGLFEVDEVKSADHVVVTFIERTPRAQHS